MGKQVVVGLLMSLLCACSSGGSGTFSHRDRPRREAANSLCPVQPKTKSRSIERLFHEADRRLLFLLGLGVRQVGDGAFEHFGRQTH